MRYAIEHDLPAATPVPEMRKPFDVLAEGLVSKKSRGERAQIELFADGAMALDLCIQRLILLAA